jgi:hypothetical protein
MNTGQMLITVAAMVLLATLILRMNNTFSNSTNTVYDSKFAILASDKSFDEATDSIAVSSLNDLTPAGSLDPESGEVYPNFNDVDDYNGFIKVDSTLPSAVFKATCKVDYVNPNSPEVTSTARTWTKRISITITSISMADTVRLSSLYSYWVFR